MENYGGNMSKNLLDLEDSGVQYGLEGVKILFYGKNTLGKTPNAMKFPKPLLMMGETGGSAIKGKKIKIKDRKDFIYRVAELTNEKTLEAMKEKFQTIVIDTVEDIAEMFDTAVARDYGARDVGEIQNLQKGNPNGYTLSRKQFKQQINILTGVGYTVIFIAHVNTEEREKVVDGKIVKYNFYIPKGAKTDSNASSSFIRDLCDYRFYIRGNGVDEQTGKKILSTACCYETEEYYAGSRFEGMPQFISPFSAELITEAIQKSQEYTADAQGSELETFKIETSGFTKEEYLEAIKPYYSSLTKTFPNEISRIIKNSLGVDEQGKMRSPTSISENELSLLDRLYCDLCIFAQERNIEIELD